MLPKEDVVGGVGVERRIEVDEVYGFREDFVAKDGQVVPKWSWLRQLVGVVMGLMIEDEAVV